MPTITPDNNAAPQFGTAVYEHNSNGDKCAFCNQMIVGSYYRVNGLMSCGSCATQSEDNRPKASHVAFVRAVLFGLGGALLGLIIYAAFGIITGWMIGYVSLAVGFIVGKAMMFGSHGLGGKRYQIVAVILTYAAVSLAAIPIAISQMREHHTAHSQAQVQQQPTNEGDESAAKERPASAQQDAPDHTAKPRMGVAKAIATLALIGLASPFLELTADPFHGLIGLVILFIGIRIAWKSTAGGGLAEVTGPYDV